MKKGILFAIFFGIILFTVFLEEANADVFVYVENGNITINDVIREDTALWIDCIEVGIMDALFEGGHIVFSNNSGKNQIDDLKSLHEIAKTGGARIFISAVLNIKIVDSEMIISGEYKVYNLYTGNTIYTNSYVFNDALQRGLQGIEDKLFKAGQNIGTIVVSTLGNVVVSTVDNAVAATL